jgi:hypothetical protein
MWVLTGESETENIRRLRAVIGVLAIILGVIALILFGSREGSMGASPSLAPTSTARAAEIIAESSSGQLSTADASVAPERVAVEAVDEAAGIDTYSVFGRISDKTAQGLAGIRMRYAPNVGRATDGLTDADGNYSITGLSEGSGSVHAIGDGFTTLSRDVTLSPDEPRVRVDGILDATRTIRIVLFGTSAEVTTDDLTVEGWTGILNVAFVSIRPKVGDVLPRTGRTTPLRQTWASPPLNLQGYWYDAEFERGTPLFACALLGAIVMDAQLVPEESGSVNLVIDYERLRPSMAHAEGQVVDFETGLPLAGVRVSTSHGVKAGTSSSDAQGRWRTGDLMPGASSVGFDFEGYMPEAHEFTVSPGETKDMGVVRLHPGVHVEGHLVYPDGSVAVTELRVRCLDGNGLPLERSTVTTFVDPSDGSFELLGAQKAVYEIAPSDGRLGRSRYELWPDSVRIDATKGSVHDVRVVLPRPADH